jgi:hypothetical protein
MSLLSRAVTNCPFMSAGYTNSGILPPRKRSTFGVVVFPNVTSRPPLSSRGRFRPALTPRHSDA